MNNILTKEEVREIINEKYDRKDFIHRHLETFIYKEYERIVYSKYKNKQQTNGLRIYRSKNPFIILFIISIVFLFTFPIFNSGNPTTFFIKTIYFICIFTIITCGYKIFFTKEIFIQINPNSFELRRDREIFWDEILITGTLIFPGKARRELVILGLKTGEIVKIDIDKTEISSTDFIQIINLNKTEKI